MIEHVILHLRNFKWLLEKCRHPNTTPGSCAPFPGTPSTFMAVASGRPWPPHAQATTQFPPLPEPSSKRLTARQCSLLNAPFFPVRSSSHVCLLRALPQFLHLQLASLSTSFCGALIVPLILPYLDSLWSVCLTSMQLLEE